MNTCIWCNLNAENIGVTFNNRAHTIPQSLGGRFLCEDICDSCNRYFGSPYSNKIGIETVLREAFELTRYMVFANKKKSNNYARFKSSFFKLNEKNNTFSLKQIYSVRPGFQSSIARQFKRGLFKIFLEEYHRQCYQAFDERFNFIREFARYDFDDYPIFYLVPKLPALFYSEDEFISPMLNFGEYQLKKMAEYEFYEMNIFGHGFLIPTNKAWYLNFDNYISRAKIDLEPMYKKIVLIKNFHDVDFACEFMKFEGSHWDR